jgi:hypothetical protein
MLYPLLRCELRDILFPMGEGLGYGWGEGGSESLVKPKIFSLERFKLLVGSVLAEANVMVLD